PFRGAIDTASSEGVATREGAYVYDVASAAADHRRGHDTRNHENAFEVGVEYAVPVGLGLLMGRTEQTNACIVDQNGYRAERGLGFVHECAYIGGAGDVGDLRINGRTLFFHLGLGS